MKGVYGRAPAAAWNKDGSKAAKPTFLISHFLFLFLLLFFFSSNPSPSPNLSHSKLHDSIPPSLPSKKSHSPSYFHPSQKATPGTKVVYSNVIQAVSVQRKYWYRFFITSAVPLGPTTLLIHICGLPPQGGVRGRMGE